MQLLSARLCLDCEEVHAENHCPVCASRQFAFLTQWLPADKPARPFQSFQVPPRVEAPAGAEAR
jgi:hypothetical protein